MLYDVKASGKLSGQLTALKLSGGTLVGQTPGGGVVVQVAEPTLKKLTAAKTARVERKVPAKVSAANRLILSYGKGAKPSAADLKKNGLQVIKDAERQDGGMLLVEATTPLTAATVTALEKVPGLTHAELDQVVSIPTPPKGPKKPAKQNP